MKLNWQFLSVFECKFFYRIVSVRYSVALSLLAVAPAAAAKFAEMHWLYGLWRH